MEQQELLESMLESILLLIRRAHFLNQKQYTLLLNVPSSLGKKHIGSKEKVEKCAKKFKRL